MMDSIIGIPVLGNNVDTSSLTVVGKFTSDVSGISYDVCCVLSATFRRGVSSGSYTFAALLGPVFFVGGCSNVYVPVTVGAGVDTELLVTSSSSSNVKFNSPISVSGILYKIP